MQGDTMLAILPFDIASAQRLKAPGVEAVGQGQPTKPLLHWDMNTIGGGVPYHQADQSPAAVTRRSACQLRAISKK